MTTLAGSAETGQIERVHLERVGKPIRSRVDVPKALLESLYVAQNMSTLEIAKVLGTSKRTIRLRLLEHNIPMRTLKKAFEVSRTHQRNSPRTGAAASSWKGGRKLHTGYWMVMQKDHPGANRYGYVFEHRLVAEQTLGRYLLPDEEVHHINEVRTDNRPENLQVMSKSAHMSLHMTKRHANRRTQEVSR